MLDSIKDWFVDRLHKYMDAAREIVENNEGIRSAETYYSTVKATLKKEAALLTKTFCIGMGGILATLLCGWLAELLGHGILKVISAVLCKPPLEFVIHFLLTGFAQFSCFALPLLLLLLHNGKPSFPS